MIDLDPKTSHHCNLNPALNSPNQRSLVIARFREADQRYLALQATTKFIGPVGLTTRVGRSVEHVLVWQRDAGLIRRMGAIQALELGSVYKAAVHAAYPI